jgi:hypothetical protein
MAAFMKKCMHDFGKLRMNCTIVAKMRDSKRSIGTHQGKEIETDLGNFLIC